MVIDIVMVFHIYLNVLLDIRPYSHSVFFIKAGMDE